MDFEKQIQADRESLILDIMEKIEYAPGKERW